MLHVALWEPEIPPNTGNIARLCAATGAALHLIGRLGFRIDERSLRRAGLDYWQDVDLQQHATMAEFEAAFAGPLTPTPLPRGGGEGSGIETASTVDRLFCLSAHATKVYTQFQYQDGDIFLFGPETRGLPEEILSRYGERSALIPIPTGKVRSLNLANAVGIVIYEALRQLRD